MKRTNLYLDAEQADSLDELARAQGISRAELVRRFLDRNINETSSDIESELAAIEESFGVLGEDIYVHRRPDERAAHLERVRNR